MTINEHEKNFNTYNLIYNEIKNDIFSINTLDFKSIKKLSSYSKHLIKSGRYDDFDFICEKAFMLVSSPLWEDLIKINQEFVLDFMYIYTCASNLKSTYLNDNEKLNYSIIPLLDIINGEYLRSCEWTEKDIIEFQFLCTLLNIKCPIQEKYSIGSNLIWTWTPENIETFKSFMYANLNGEKAIYNYYLETLIISNFLSQKYEDIIQLLSISSDPIQNKYLHVITQRLDLMQFSVEAKIVILCISNFKVKEVSK